LKGGFIALEPLACKSSDEEFEGKLRACFEGDDVSNEVFLLIAGLEEAMGSVGFRSIGVSFESVSFLILILISSGFRISPTV
jgi:hypothetical protein